MVRFQPESPDLETFCSKSFYQSYSISEVKMELSWICIYHLPTTAFEDDDLALYATYSFTFGTTTDDTRKCDCDLTREFEGLLRLSDLVVSLASVVAEVGWLDFADDEGVAAAAHLHDPALGRVKSQSVTEPHHLRKYFISLKGKT